MHERTTKIVPLSFSQQSLWFLDQLSPGNPFYNVPVVYRLDGALDDNALDAAFSQIVQRHAALRTHFDVADGEPVQVVSPDIDFRIERIDLETVPAGERLEAAMDLAREEVCKPFDLRCPPLLRAMLQRLSPGQHILVLTMHHIVSDKWSMELLQRELMVAYNAARRQTTVDLPPLPFQFFDFAAWQRKHLEGPTLEAELDYWAKRLGNDTPILQLPADHPRPPVQSFRGAEYRFLLNPALQQKLNELARQQGATLFMVLLAAFNVLLHRYSGQHDITVGTPVANRLSVELESLIGCFTNTLALRTDLSGNPSFAELLGRVRETTFDAYEHQDLPFEKLVQTLQPNRSLSHNPLFQAMLVLHNVPLSTENFDGLTHTQQNVSTGTSQFDLTLTIKQHGETMEGILVYSTDLFEHATIQRLVTHFQNLLEGIVRNPETPIGKLPLLSAAEYRQLVQEWNATDMPFPADHGMHALFEAQAAKTPDATALIDGETRLSYGALNTRANRLAHHLRGLGVAPDELVGLCMTRGADMIVAQLAILKAGGAYLPLDPNYPPERVAYMLQDGRAHLLITQEALLDTLPATEARLLCMDRDAAAFAQESPDDPEPIHQPEHLAYVIYTSGSTGKPKGVAIQHRNAQAFIHWAQSRYSADELRGVLAATSLCFDLSIFEIFVPLSTGGTSILAENALALPGLPAAQEVTLINTVPSAIAELHDIDGIPDSVRTINLAGEALKGELVQNLYRHPHIKRVWNLYGPSETTTYSTEALMKRDETTPLIGRPIANTQIYILDAYMNPVPIGAVGEIHIGGAGVARGYLHQPELSAVRFLPNPFQFTPNSKMYKTGDLARYQSDGQIAYLGRADNQVKVRGFRIELDEIEKVLGAYPAIQASVVLAREDKLGHKQLVAYYTAASGMQDTQALRQFLHRHLPDYMIPAAFMHMERFPLTPNGKIDRKRFPAPTLQHFGRQDDFSAPRNDVEAKLAKMWGEILGLEQLSIHDNFFHLGGHSLLATQLISRIRDAFQVELSIRSVFEASTIARQATLISDKHAERHAAPNEEDKIASILQKLDGLSEDELKAMLEAKRQTLRNQMGV